MFLKYQLKFYVLVVTLGLLLVPGAYADFNLTLQDIVLEPGITADINIVVFENNSGFCQALSANELNASSIFAETCQH